MDVAVGNVAVGGGIVLGSVALLIIKLLAFSYEQSNQTFVVACWMGAVSIAACAIVLARKELRPFRILLITTGAVASASLILQFALIGRWELRAVYIALSIGSGILIAGLAMWRGYAWGGYLHMAIAAAPAVTFWSMAIAFRSTALTILGLIVLFVPFAFLEAFLAISMPGRAAAWRSTPLFSFRTLVQILLAAGLLLSVMISPSLMISFQTSRQKRTMYSMRIISDAVERYGEKHGAYPEAHSLAELARVLQRDSIGPVPETDAWRLPFDYDRVIPPAKKEEGYVIRSAGADNIFEQTNPTAYAGGGVQGFERDLVYSTISEPQWPEGMMPP